MYVMVSGSQSLMGLKERLQVDKPDILVIMADDHIFRDVLNLQNWVDEVAKDYAVAVNVAGTPNALERLFNSLPDKDKRRE